MGNQFIFDGRAEASTGVGQIEAHSSRDERPKPSLFDRAFAVAVLLAFAPLLLALTALIAIGGQHPFFLQERVGHGGRLFWIFKFRTMPDEGWAAAEMRANESAVAGIRLAIFRSVSAVLRNTGLDELPQFANILRGDMQILGPRPLMMVDFMALPERRLERCSVLPGITGLAQINGGQELDSESKLALDLYLIAHSSFGDAARIVAHTVLRILGFTGATAKASATDLERARQYMQAGSQDAAPRRPLAEPRRPARRTRLIRMMPAARMFKSAPSDMRPDFDGASRTAP